MSTKEKRKNKTKNTNKEELINNRPDNNTNNSVDTSVEKNLANDNKTSKNDATETKANKIKNNKLLKNKFFMTAIGIVLFFVIGEYGAIHTGVQDMYIYFQYPLLYMFAATYGSVPGLIVGLVGHLLIDIVRQDIWFSWITASGIMGFMIGFIYERKKEQGKSELVRLFKFFLICAGTIAVVFGIYAPTINILCYHLAPKTAFTQSLFAALSDAVITLIVVHLFYFSYKSAVIRRIIAFIVILDSLLLLSYGNRGIGSVVVYLFTIVICMITFLHSLVDSIVAKSKFKVFWYAAIGVFLVVISLFSFLLVSGHVNNPKGNEQVVIVLGAGLAGDKPNAILARRLDKAADYAEKNPDCIIITSGGQGPAEVVSEAFAMKNYLLEKGVEESRVFMEDRSTTTEENLRFSLEIMKGLGYDELSQVVITTNDFHCFRSSKYAEEEGFENVCTLPASTPYMTWLPNYIREIMALGKYILKTI